MCVPKVKQMQNLRGQMGSFGSNLPFCPLMKPLGMVGMGGVSWLQLIA